MGKKISSVKSHANQGNHQIKIQIEWTHSLLCASKVQGVKYSLPLHALSESCSLKEKHLNGFRKIFQFPKGTSVRLPCLGEKACNFAHREVCFYEADFLCGLHFPVHPFIMQLLNEFQIAPVQLIPNAWRMIISCMSIWMSACDGEMITLKEFLFLYRLKTSTHYGYFELLPWDRKSRIVRGFPSSFWDWKSRYFFISGTGWETLSDDFWGEVPRLLRKWEVPALGAYFHYLLLFFFHIVIAHLMIFPSDFLQLLIILT